MPSDWDVVVVGGGGSGLAAAVSAAESGCSVIVLEKLPVPGGTTGMAVGSFTASCTALQRRAGITDSVAAHIEDAGRFAPPAIEARNNEELRRFFLAHSSEALEWLRGLGLNFVGPNPEPPNRAPRMHNVVPGARAYVLALQRKLLRLGGRLECSAPVVALLRDRDRVIGVRARIGGREIEIRARRAVVLAAGDYANAPRLIAEFKGDRFAAIEGINPNASGDGQNLARSVGAPLINMDVTYGPELRFVPPPRRGWQEWLPASGPLVGIMGRIAPRLPQFILNAFIKRLLVAWQHPEDALFRDGAILLNRNGERFCNEQKSPEREIAIAAQPGKEAFLLLDQRLCQLYSAWPHFISTAPRIAYAYVADYERLRRDVFGRGPDLTSVVASRGLPAAAVAESVADFNAGVSAGRDRFGRTGDSHPLTGRDWVLLGPARAYFTTTEGSPAIDTNFAVLDADRNPIPGLYAVGQNGIGGQVLWGHGLKIGWAITSGRLVGRVLAGQPVSSGAPRSAPASALQPGKAP